MNNVTYTLRDVIVMTETDDVYSTGMVHIWICNSGAYSVEESDQYSSAVSRRTHRYVHCCNLHARLCATHWGRYSARDSETAVSTVLRVSVLWWLNGENGSLVSIIPWWRPWHGTAWFQPLNGWNGWTGEVYVLLTMFLEKLTGKYRPSGEALDVFFIRLSRLLILKSSSVLQYMTWANRMKQQAFISFSVVEHSLV